MILNAKGTIIEINNDAQLVKLSPVLTTFIETPMNNNNLDNEYYLDYESDVVQALTNYLNGDEIYTKKISKIMDELLIHEKIYYYISKEKLIRVVEEINDDGYVVNLMKDFVLKKIFINTQPICAIFENVNENITETFAKPKIIFFDEHLNKICVGQRWNSQMRDNEYFINVSDKFVFCAYDMLGAFNAYDRYTKYMETIDKISRNKIDKFLRKIKKLALKSSSNLVANNNDDNIYFVTRNDSKGNTDDLITTITLDFINSFK